MKLKVILLAVINLSCGTGVEFASKRSDKKMFTPEQIEALNKVSKKEFSAGTFKMQEKNISPQFNNISTTIEMIDTPEKIYRYSQKSRPMQQVSFTQGTNGSTILERFDLKRKGVLDILIVMDDSGTMKTTQSRVASHLDSLLNQLHKVNWQIAVATTTSSCLRSFDGVTLLTADDYKSNPDAVERLYRGLIVAGTDGSPKERGIKSAAEAAIGKCGNTVNDWKRPDSKLAILIVTDEKHCGSAQKEGCEGEPWNKSSYVFNTVNRPKEKIQVFGLLMKQTADQYSESSGPCPGSGGYDDQYPTEYIRLIEETGGIHSEICQFNFGPVLTEISASVSAGIKTDFILRHAPTPETTIVTIGGNPVPFEVKGRALNIKADTSHIDLELKVSYKYGPSTVKDSFVLGKADPDTVTVTINQKSIPASEWIYIPQNEVIQFASTPIENSSIVISFRQPGDLSNIFFIPREILLSKMTIFVEGTQIENYVVDATESTLTLPLTPLDGDQIVITYKKRNSKRTKYKLPKASKEIESIQAYTQSSGDKVPFTVSGDYIIFPEDQVQHGKKINLEISLVQDGDTIAFKVDLPENVVPQSMTLKGGDPSCSIQNYKKSASISCKDDNFESIQLDYMTLEEFRNTFNIGEEPSSLRQLKVSIDGTPCHEFLWQGSFLIIPYKYLKPTSKVQVEIGPK